MLHVSLRLYVLCNLCHCYFRFVDVTAKPLNLAAIKVGDFTCKIILAPFILVNSNHTSLRQHTIPIKVGIVSIFSPFNFAVLFSLRNKGHAKIKGFTVSNDRYRPTYTRCLKKTIQLTFDHNFGKCRPVFKILSLTD